MINFISGGSDICGTSCSIARRHAKEARMENGERPTKTSTLTTETLISFEEQDRENIMDPHHDGNGFIRYLTNRIVLFSDPVPPPPRTPVLRALSHMDSSMCSSAPDPKMWIIQGTLAWGTPPVRTGV
ncbi:hypothetical protein E3N88_00367 [Mikania micrantha]|uniref:Uncharacterized protein n=1 Tax=Mikania micrantha TaxID=192012 RepID=A0A5N6PZU5_9ASTR|nr:hypothetical protein E3N88_00367 [Mikania micrantha]